MLSKEAKFLLYRNLLLIEYYVPICIILYAGLSASCWRLATDHPGPYTSSFSPWGHVHMVEVCITVQEVWALGKWRECSRTYHITWMQDDSNLRHPPKNKISAKKQYFTINFIHLIHKACQILFYLPLPISFAVSFFTISSFIFLTLNPNIPILLTAIPKHVSISLVHCIGYMAFLTTLHN